MRFRTVVGSLCLAVALAVPGTAVSAKAQPTQPPVSPKQALAAQMATQQAVTPQANPPLPWNTNLWLYTSVPPNRSATCNVAFKAPYRNTVNIKVTNTLCMGPLKAEAYPYNNDLSVAHVYDSVPRLGDTYTLRASTDICYVWLTVYNAVTGYLVDVVFWLANHSVF